MPDDLSKRRPQDASRINLNQPYEVAWWCAEFGCTEAQLRAAVDIAGVGAEAVRAQLAKSKR
ncbi:DUF3606 domain-containing protein [Myxococcota bacterium]|nr:DUF3606 domain-containing protein [Myxococcota bacterium]MCK6566042.1 DUF3606 domain-containing protein [Dehalococcoidia bacterium]